jgi:N-acetylglucosaminyldiphosphoundecaprenol N-acetyl-beta-D-mannosaminyltransferase
MSVFEERVSAPQAGVGDGKNGTAEIAAALLAHPDFERWLDASPRRVPMHTVEVDAVTQAQALDRIFGALDMGRGGTVITPNLDIVRQARNDHELRDLIASADLVLADGMPLVWASRITRNVLPERVAGSDLILPLCERASEEGRSVYILGGCEGAAESCAIEFARRFPDLKIAGTHCPPLGFEHDGHELRVINEKLITSEADIILLALGTPKQERLMASLRDVVPNAWMLGVGAAIDFIAGEQRRAPTFMRRTGLEWTYRLACEPRRLGRRYVREGLPFAGQLCAWAVRQRFV